MESAPGLGIVHDFDAFIQVVGNAIARTQSLEQETSELKAELEATRNTIEILREVLGKKDANIEELQQERYRISQELTQNSFDSGNVVLATEQACKLKYELDIANTAITVSRRELKTLRTENERLRRSTGHKRSLHSTHNA